MNIRRVAAADRLVASGLKLFGERGFDAISVRELARDAGVNLAALNYHFGSKQGLRAACAQEAATMLRCAFGTAGLDELTHMEIDRLTPCEARARLAATLHDLARLVTATNRRADCMRFVQCELATSAETRRLLNAQFFTPILATIAALFEVQSGRVLTDRECRLRALALFGQATCFVWLRPVAAAHLDIERFDESLVESLVTQLRID